MPFLSVNENIKNIPSDKYNKLTSVETVKKENIKLIFIVNMTYHIPR